MTPAEVVVMMIALATVVLVGIVVLIGRSRVNTASAALDTLRAEWAAAREDDEASHAVETAQMAARLDALSELQAKRAEQVEESVGAAIKEGRSSLARSLEEGLAQLNQRHEEISVMAANRLEAAVDERLARQREVVDESLQQWKSEVEREIAELLKRHLDLVRTELSASQFATGPDA